VIKSATRENFLRKNIYIPKIPTKDLELEIIPKLLDDTHLDETYLFNQEIDSHLVLKVFDEKEVQNILRV